MAGSKAEKAAAAATVLENCLIAERDIAGL